MKNTLLKKILIGLMILLYAVGVSSAGDSSSIHVSCTIPAIPGVNAPPITEEKTVKQETDKMVEQKTENQQAETESESPSMIQEDEKETRLANGKTTSVVLKTVYIR